MQEPSEPTHRSTAEHGSVVQKFLSNKERAWIIGGACAAVIIVGLVALGVVLTTKKPGSGANTSQSASSDDALRATGYTGITADVLSNSPAFDCSPRNENEWYRSDHTLTVDYANPDIMYINVEYKGIYKSTDGGKTWAQKVKGIKVYPRKDDTSKGCYSEYPVIQMDPKDHKHLVIGLSSGGGANLDAKTPNSQVGGVYQSFDGAETWQLMINNKMNTYVNDVAFDPADSKTVYYSTSSIPASWQGADQNKLFVTKGLLYKTTDTGKTWTELPTGIGNNSGFESILINPANPKEIYGPTYSAVRQSADGTGTGISNGKNSSAVSQLGIFKSTDAGKSWTTIKTPDSVPLPHGYASPTNFQHMFFVPNGTTGQPYGYVTLDGGATIKKTTYMDIVSYDPHDATGNHAYGYSTTAGTPTIPNMNLFETTDGGLTWKASAGGTLPKEMKDLNNPKTRPSKIIWHPTDPNTLFMAGAGGHIWKTTDLGKTWTTLTSYEKLP
jgi:photosystem II stability/assembly factor-like uncharacterized protein